MRDHELPPHPRLSFLFRQLHEQAAREIDAALREAGFTDIYPGQSKVFPFVPAEGVPVSELARLVGVRKQTMAQAVTELERSGYLERRPNPRDARSRLVFLTDRGRAAHPIAAKAGRAVEEHWAELVGAPELDRARDVLRRLFELLRSEGEVPTDQRGGATPIANAPTVGK
jgi:DNA-binding MarR family transcriptional regulator